MVSEVFDPSESQDGPHEKEKNQKIEQAIIFFFRVPKMRNSMGPMWNISFIFCFLLFFWRFPIFEIESAGNSNEIGLCFRIQLLFLEQICTELTKTWIGAIVSFHSTQRKKIEQSWRTFSPPMFGETWTTDTCKACATSPHLFLFSMITVSCSLFGHLQWIKFENVNRKRILPIL